jgi:hypothetical protein
VKEATDALSLVETDYVASCSCAMETFEANRPKAEVQVEHYAQGDLTYQIAPSWTLAGELEQLKLCPTAHNYLGQFVTLWSTSICRTGSTIYGHQT